MTAADQFIGDDHERSNWVRSRTLLRVRWFAILGQSVTMLIAEQLYGLQLQTRYALIAIGIAVVTNIYINAVHTETKRLSEPEALFMLVIDILQLGFLLFVTGGLANPFAVMILAPITIAATVLQLRSTLTICMVAITLITLLSQFSLPILSQTGVALFLPPLFQFGFWAALVISIIFIAIYARQITRETHAMADALLATQLALAREQKLTDLGGVVAAAAHELGTPLATIKLVSAELMEELRDKPELREDAQLMRDQADRCREILHSMGRAGKDDLHMRYAPLETVVREAGDPHANRGKTLNYYVVPLEDDLRTQPLIPRRPEIIHGLRNLIQNAVDFAETTVDIEVSWNADLIRVRIVDDGEGFPASVINRIGDPFVKRKRLTNDRPEYKGMGLGLFIAKTLLERSSAQLTFSNGRKGPHAGWAGQAAGGAIVMVAWPRDTSFLRAPAPDSALGENQRFS